METPVTFKNKNGMQLVGMLHMPDKGRADKTVVMCHGFGGNKTQKMFVDTARFLCDNNFSVLRFDFTGHGDSQGTYTDYSIKNEIDDLDCAIKFLETFDTINTNNIGLVGHSLGAVISFMYAKIYKNIKSVVFLAPAFNQKELMLLWYSKEQIHELKLNGKIDIEKQTITKEFFDESCAIDLTDDFVNFEIPACIIHGGEDETVPVSYSESFKKYETETKKIFILEKSEHKLKDLKSREFIKKNVVDWFLKWLK